MTANKILINRAPVLTLWAAVVAERLGFNHDEALSLGKALAGLNTQSKGQRLGIFHPSPKELKKVHERKPSEEFQVALFGRALPAVNSDQGDYADSRRSCRGAGKWVGRHCVTIRQNSPTILSVLSHYSATPPRRLHLFWRVRECFGESNGARRERIETRRCCRQSCGSVGHARAAGERWMPARQRGRPPPPFLVLSDPTA